MTKYKRNSWNPWAISTKGILKLIRGEMEGLIFYNGISSKGVFKHIIRYIHINITKRYNFILTM